MILRQFLPQTFVFLSSARLRLETTDSNFQFVWQKSNEKIKKEREKEYFLFIPIDLYNTQVQKYKILKY